MCVCGGGGGEGPWVVSLKIAAGGALLSTHPPLDEVCVAAEAHLHLRIVCTVQAFTHPHTPNTHLTFLIYTPHTRLCTKQEEYAKASTELATCRETLKHLRSEHARHKRALQMLQGLSGNNRAAAAAALGAEEDGCGGMDDPMPAVASSAVAAAGLVTQALEAERAAREGVAAKLRDAKLSVDRKNVLIRWGRGRGDTHTLTSTCLHVDALTHSLARSCRPQTHSLAHAAPKPLPSSGS